MRSFCLVSLVVAVLLGVFLPPALAFWKVTPRPRVCDPYPELPPLSDLALLPTPEVITEWKNLQTKAVKAEEAKLSGLTLAFQDTKPDDPTAVALFKAQVQSQRSLQTIM